MIVLINSYKNGMWKKYFQINLNRLHERWELILNIGESPNDKHDQWYYTWFLEKYCGLSLYDIYIENRCTIDDEDLHFVKKYGYDLIGNPDNPDGASTDHAYFILHDDLFDIILETDQN